jgi:hypothetical protein
VKDVRSRIEKLLTDAGECDLIANLATIPEKREAFRKLAGDYRKMAREVETIAISGVIPDDRQQ